jgi:pimeloyl-ACP methyl ester carboxylesterase
MPPFGYSGRPSTADYGDSAQARRILGVVTALGLERVTLVGHSFGARPAMEAYFPDPDRFSRLVLVDAALGLDTTARAKADVPSLVIWGSADAVTPVAGGRDIEQLIPGATWVELAGVGHIPAIEATDRFDALLVAWLQRREPRGLSASSR